MASLFYLPAVQAPCLPLSTILANASPNSQQEIHQNISFPQHFSFPDFSPSEPGEISCLLFYNYKPTPSRDHEGK